MKNLNGKVRGKTQAAQPLQRAVSKDGSRHVTDEQINTITAMAGAILAVLASGLLIATAVELADWWKVIGVSVYGFSLVALFCMSALHHAVDGSERTNTVLRKLDYVSIFVLIAGTTTPLILAYARTVPGWTLLALLWLLAGLGITLVASMRSLPRHITNTFYIVMGWSPLFMLAVTRGSLPPMALALLAAGGIMYSLGFAMYTLERPNIVPGKFGFHELWHCIIIVAAALHFLCMYIYVAS